MFIFLVGKNLVTFVTLSCFVIFTCLRAWSLDGRPQTRFIVAVISWSHTAAAAFPGFGRALAGLFSRCCCCSRPAAGRPWALFIVSGPLTGLKTDDALSLAACAFDPSLICDRCYVLFCENSIHRSRGWNGGREEMSRRGSVLRIKCLMDEVSRGFAPRRPTFTELRKRCAKNRSTFTLWNLLGAHSERSEKLLRSARKDLHQKDPWRQNGVEFELIVTKM